MPDFATFDLGRVFAAAESINSMRRQQKSDALQERYLDQRIKQGDAEMQRQQRADQIVIGRDKATQIAVKSQQILQAPDVKSYVEQAEPDLVKHLTEAGRDWATMDDAAIKAEVTAMMNRANQELGVAPAAPVTSQQVGDFQTLQQDGKVLASVAPPKPDVITPYQQAQLKNDSERLEIERRRAAQPQGGQAPPSGYRYDQQGNLAFIPGGPADPARKNDVLRPIPAAVAQGISGNRNQLAKLDRAIAAVDANPDAFGLKNFTPDVIQQRLPGKGNSGGVGERAQVADIGSMIIHDRSGAAVSASEFPRLRPFIPAATDDPKVVKTKLQNLRANLAAIQEETESLYSPETGYKPFGGESPKNRGASGSWGEPGQEAKIGGFTVRRVK